MVVCSRLSLFIDPIVSTTVATSSSQPVSSVPKIAQPAGPGAAVAVRALGQFASAERAWSHRAPSMAVILSERPPGSDQISRIGREGLAHVSRAGAEAIGLVLAVAQRLIDRQLERRQPLAPALAERVNDQPGRGGSWPGPRAPHSSGLERALRVGHNGHSARARSSGAHSVSRNQDAASLASTARRDGRSLPSPC